MRCAALLIRTGSFGSALPSGNTHCIKWYEYYTLLAEKKQSFAPLGKYVYINKNI
jgi:hypothetical protein